MTVSKTVVVQFAMVVLMAVSVAGCRKARTTPPRFGEGAEIIGGEVGALPGDYELAQRFGPNAKPAQDVRFPNVHFAFDSFRVEDSELAIIEQVASAMQNESALVVVIDGHCDVRGSSEYNMSLGEHRALAVRSNLIRLGIDGERAQTRSFGKEMPLDPGFSEAAHQVNRRAEFIFFRR